IRWLNVNRSPLDVANDSEVVKFLSAAERQLLGEVGAAIVLPLIVLNRLTGLIFISQRLNGQAYMEEDVLLLGTLAVRSALAIEHAAMHEFQEDRLKRIVHADKLATAGELAAGAAHEIRNPLTSIRSTMQYLRKDLAADKSALVDGLIHEVDRIDRI